MEPIDFAELEKRVREDEDRELAAFLKGSAEAPTIYRVRGDAVKAIPQDDGPIEFVASEESDDRAGDLVHADGWDLSAFKKNAVMPWSHDYRVAPIGRWQKVHVEGKQLLGLAIFDKNDPFAAQIESKYRTKFLSAVSVGFRPLEFAEREDGKASSNPFRRGYDFKKQELLEISAVSVPMHPKALRKGLALAENAPIWVFMPGDSPGAFKAVQPMAAPKLKPSEAVGDIPVPKDMDEAREMLDGAISMHREHMDDSKSITPERMREQMRLMRGARREMKALSASVPLVTSGLWQCMGPITTTSGGDAPPPTATVQPKQKPPDGGQGDEADLSAVVAALKRVRA